MLVQKTAQVMMQELLEAEGSEFLGRSHYARQGEGTNRGYRNGEEPMGVKTAERDRYRR